MKKSPHVHRNSASFIRYYGNTNLTLSLLAETLPATKETALFDYPFNELLVNMHINFNNANKNSLINMGESLYFHSSNLDVHFH